MTELYLNPDHPAFPQEPDYPEELNSALRAGLVGWVATSLEALEDECIIRTRDEEAGILEVLFPALPAAQAVEALEAEGVHCTVGAKHAVRFTLSAGQSFEALEALVPILKKVLGLND